MAPFRFLHADITSPYEVEEPMAWTTFLPPLKSYCHTPLPSA